MIYLFMKIIAQSLTTIIINYELLSSRGDIFAEQNYILSGDLPAEH